MPENTVTTLLAPMEPEDVAVAFAYIRALQADDIDTACAVVDGMGPEVIGGHRQRPSAEAPLPR
ncbi:hypothetical protein ACFW5X_34505 [Streptomyces albogriseolus]|uniref:hypothetical protein n=1 Tax=Streptomyces albogriseolus TaxID=1887 RepID=UPI00367D9E52